MQIGTLYIVATPIGNLTDITQRALEILKSVHWIAAEDTRHSKKLLAHFGIQTSIFSLHNYNENKKCESVLAKLKQGESIALISDAGTPLISDPGYRLVSEARKQAIPVVPVPGACALITALCASGLPSDRFCFEGFLPAKSSARLAQLKNLKNETRTLIFYESPHRLILSLKDMKKIFGTDRQCVIARELTKTFETIHEDTLENIIQWIEQDFNQQKGEFVILIRGNEKEISASLESIEQVLAVLMEELPLSQAVKLAAKITGEKKSIVYDMALNREKGKGKRKKMSRDKS
ncbi:MAG: 16S rRNA (cytidine(1402)-2'-O)-methyltransferase [Gammaproteobacteria bacterium RIFOXYB2_FULL_38_6]|nr:MAG: 16S rRNA (cytidine(1402)-2'-O)-methyltransferase [Gammaproteobacteria bacterium RIFOXYB2_FULL_38_6]